MPLSSQPPAKNRVLLIACGALAREIIDVVRMNAWHHMTVTCLPAIWHNTPHKIPEALRAKIRAARPDYHKIFVLYGDCGTGGELDWVLAEEGVERIGGAHCYAFYRGKTSLRPQDVKQQKKSNQSPDPSDASKPSSGKGLLLENIRGSNGIIQDEQRLNYRNLLRNNDRGVKAKAAF